MSVRHNERIDAYGGIQLPASAGAGKIAVSDADGNISWSAIDMATQAELDAEATTRAAADTALSAVDTAIVGAYKVVRERGGQVATGSSGTRILLPDQTVGSTATSAGRGVFYFDPADYAVAGKTTKLRLRAIVLTNDVAPGGNITFGLRPISAVSGASGALGITLAAAVSGSGVAINTPLADSMNTASSGDFDASGAAAGYYAFSALLGAALPAACELVVRALLSVRQV